ncbi:MAG: hypothetical protein F4037_06215 [Gemmatimonadales bacterium]|nr:hypothetical protein [Gemmatimonadales bacterium]MYK01532.1 hypothetical protein [Candidatus Palauibacter ramosifaciens]
MTSRAARHGEAENGHGGFGNWPSRGELTAVPTTLSANSADCAVGRTGGDVASPGGARRGSRRCIAVSLAFVALAAASPSPVTARQAHQESLVYGVGREDASAFARAELEVETADLSPAAILDRKQSALANPPAAGRPRVSAWGTRSWKDSVRVGATARAVTDSIRDADGLDHVQWEYQWVRVLSGGGQVDIPEAQRSWYYVGENDRGHRLKVRVGFQDDEGNRESLESDLSAVVGAMADTAYAYVSLAADRDTAEVGEWVTFTIRRHGEMQKQIRGDINVRGIESPIRDWNLYAFVFRSPQQLTRTWRLQVQAEPNGAQTPGRTVTALLRGVFDDHAVADTSAARVVVVPAGTRNRGDVGSPDAEGATVNGSTLIINYNEALDSSSEPATNAYSVRINGGSGTSPSRVEVSGRTVTLGLGSPAAYGDRVTLDYTAPNTGAIRDEAMNEAGDLTDYPVTNRTPAPTPVIEAQATLRLVEDVGTHSFTVSLSRSLNQSVTVSVSAQAGTANATSDFRIPGATLTIPAGKTSSDALTVTIVDDDLDEGDETFTLVLNSPSGAALGNRTTTVTIVDDDTRGLFPNLRAVDVPEGGTAQYTLVLESEPTETVAVTASTSGDADITVTEGATLTFTANDWYIPQPVTLGGAADADSTDGVATITHTASGGDYGDVSTNVTATEDDVSGERGGIGGTSVSTGVMLSLDRTEIGESDGQTTITVTGRLDGDAMGSAKAVTVRIGASGDPATEGTDYATVDDFTFEIGAGATEGGGTFSMTPNDDDVAESDETVTVSGSVTGLNVTRATLTIVDDDRQGLLASRGTVEVPEGGVATYTLVLESEPTATVTVTATRAGDEDITVTEGASLAFTAKDWYLPQTVTLSAAHDDDDVHGTATITHRATGGDYGANNVSTRVEAVEVDDEGKWTLYFLSDGAEVASVSEGSVDSVEVVVSRGMALAEDTDVSLSATGSAAAYSDWELRGRTITLLAGDTETKGLMSVIDDRQLEGPEAVTVQATVDGTAVAASDLEILDEDRATISLGTETPTVVEGSSVTVSLVVEPSDVGCIIPFDVSPAIEFDDSAGAVSSTVPGVVVIPACEPRAAYVFDTSDDDEVTGDRIVVLTVVSGDQRISGGMLTVTVTDNDNAPAEGAPAIGGIPRVGDTLTAHTDRIRDADGLTSASWQYQWLRVRDGSEREIAGATGRTYEAREADLGSRLKIRVDFTDDAGHDERLTSAPTDEVTARPVTPAVTIEPDLTTVREGEAARFTISAVPAPDKAVTVNVRVSGTKDIVAGVPLTTVTIGVGQDSALLAVATDDDDADEGAVAGVVTARLLAGTGYEIGTPASGDVIVLDNDEAPIADLTGWLARVGRTASDQVLETVRGRMTRGSGGSRLILGDWAVGGLRSYTGPRQSVFDLFSRSSFNASGQLAAGGGYWSAWGRGARTRFSGGEGAGAVDGAMNGFMAGVDLGRGRWMGGIVTSHNRADGTLGGSTSRARDVGTVLTGAYPWARYLVSDQLSLWGMLGYARGTLSLDGGSDHDPGASLALAAFGWRGDLVGASGAAGFALAVTSDAMLTRAGASGDGTFGDQAGGASRARLMMEGSHHFRIGEATLAPLAEVGVRSDHGDAETGVGMEMGGGLSLTVPSLGLTVQGRARGLVAHEDRHYGEWGGSALIHIEPNASGHGLSVRVAPAWGQAEGSAARLFERRDMRGIASAHGSSRYRAGLTAAEIGYGLPLAGGLVAMPYGGLTGEARRVGVGLRAVSLFHLRFEGYDGYGHRAVRLFAGLETGGFTLSLEGSSGASDGEARLSVRSRFREQ